MSIISKVTEAVVQFIPDRDRDTLSEAERLIGKPIDRLDGREKVTGAARFSAEFPLEKLAYAALAYSTIAKGTIKGIDVSRSGEGAGRNRGHHASQCAEDEGSAALQPRRRK